MQPAVAAKRTLSSAPFLLICSAVLIFSALFLSGAPASSQNTSPPRRDARAITIVQQSITAMGGAASIANISSWTAHGISQPLKNSANSETRSFTWTVSGNDFRSELGGGGHSYVFVSGHGSPQSDVDGKTHAINYHVARAMLPFYFPVYMLSLEINNLDYTILYVGTETLEGRSVIHIHTSDDTDDIGTLVTPQEWYFDPTTLLPLRVNFRLPANENAEIYHTGAFEFSNYMPTDGLQVPYSLTYYEQDKSRASITIQSFVLNSQPAPSLFDASQGDPQ